MIGTLSLHLHMPGCKSLKEKRGRLQPLLHRLRREFNVSVAEMKLQDKWQEAVIACAMVGNNSAYLQAALEAVSHWVANHWPDGQVFDEKIEIIP